MCNSICAWVSQVCYSDKRITHSRKLLNNTGDFKSDGGTFSISIAFTLCIHVFCITLIDALSMWYCAYHHTATSDSIGVAYQLSVECLTQSVSR